MRVAFGMSAPQNRDMTENQNDNPVALLIQNIRVLDHKIELLSQQNNAMNERILGAVRDVLEASSISAPQKRRIRDEVCAYISTLKNFEAKAMSGGYGSRLNLVSFAIEQAALAKDDITLEFGVFKGESLALISQRSPGKVYGFDSFEGLPASELIWKKGQFNNPGGLAYRVGPNTELVKGWFSDTIPPFVESHDMAKVKLLHMDCDIYSSSVQIFELAIEHMPQEFILLFDEYWNYEGWRDGEFKAFHDFLKKTGRTYEYLAYMDAGNSVCVRMHAQL